MSFRVRLFARARDLVGRPAVEVALPPGATVGDLRRRLADDHPGLAGLLEHSAVAVNGEFADDASALPAGGEIALLPPVSGGGRP